MTPARNQVNEAAQAAREYRTRLGLDLSGPVPDLLQVAEGVAGVAVSVLELPQGVSGAYTLQEGQGFAFVNLSDPVVRQRFTLAHELAHHVFGDGAVVDSEEAVFGSPASPVELRARTFAAEFLVPLRAVTAWMEARQASDVTLRLLVELACTFRVSAEMALIRLSLAQSLSSDSARQQLDEALRRGEHLWLQRRLGVEEPPDLLAQVRARGVPRPPAKLWELAVSGYEQGFLTVDRIAAAMLTTPQAIRDRFDELGIERFPDEPDF